MENSLKKLKQDVASLQKAIRGLTAWVALTVVAVFLLLLAMQALHVGWAD